MTSIPVDVSQIVVGQRIDAADLKTPIANLQTATQQTLDGFYRFLRTMWVDPVNLGILSDAITPTQTRHSLTNEGGGASDQVTTINGHVADLLLLEQGNLGQTTTIKHGTGNIFFDNGRDYVLDDRNKVVALVWNGLTNKWSGWQFALGSIFLDDASSDSQIISDAVTAMRTKLKLTPETGTVDSLATITNGNALDMVVLELKNSGDSITIQHNVGNIWFENQANYVLNSQNDLLLLVWNDVTSKWNNAGVNATSGITGVDEYNPASGFSINELQLPLKGYYPNGAGIIALDYTSRVCRRKQFWDDVLPGASAFNNNFGWTLTTAGTPTWTSNLEGAIVALASTTTISNPCNRRSTNAPFMWNWSPSMECRAWPNIVFATNTPVWYGFMLGTPVVTAGPVITYGAGVSGIWISPAWDGVIGHTRWVGQVYSAGAQLGSVAFGTQAINVAGVGTRPIPIFRVSIDGDTSKVLFEVEYNGVTEQATLTIGALGALATLNIDSIYGGLNYQAGVAFTTYIMSMHAEQN